MSLGEGATSEGEFWESLNTATRLHLPVLFVVADNGYAISVRSTDQHPAPISEMVRGIRGLHVVKMDGRDYFEVRRKGANAIAHVRAGAGPCLVHALVTRPYSHSLSDDQKKYRVAEELDDEREHDPITVLEQRLIAAGALTPEAAEQMRAEAKETVRAAADAALALAAARAGSRSSSTSSAPLPVTRRSRRARAARPTPPSSSRSARRSGSRCTSRWRATNASACSAKTSPTPTRTSSTKCRARAACSASRSVCSARSATRAASTRRSPRRTSSAAAVGQAMRGLRPCAEIQFFDYVWPAMNQLQVGGGDDPLAFERRVHVPDGRAHPDRRLPAGRRDLPQPVRASRSSPTCPACSIAFPSRARDAAGLLRTAFRCEDPVLFLEHKHLYRQGYNRDPMPPAGLDAAVRQGHVRDARRSRRRSSRGARPCTAPSSRSQELGADAGVEIIDLRTIAPWDHDIVAESVRKTGRVLVLHEDTLTCGFGAEIAAFVADECFEYLDAPVWRLAAADTFCAYEPSLEDAILPQVADIARDLRALLAY